MAEVTCQGCNQTFRKRDFADHWCGAFTDKTGAVVNLGDTVSYEYGDRTYIVTDMPPSFVAGGFCYGLRNGKGLPQIIKPRLMRKLPTS